MCSPRIPFNTKKLRSSPVHHFTHTYRVLRAIDPIKSCGPDGIPGRLLREGANHLSKPLTRLFNTALLEYFAGEKHLRMSQISRKFDPFAI